MRSVGAGRFPHGAPVAMHLERSSDARGTGKSPLANEPAIPGPSGGANLGLGMDLTLSGTYHGVQMEFRHR